MCERDYYVAGKYTYEVDTMTAMVLYVQFPFKPKTTELLGIYFRLKLKGCCSVSGISSHKYYGSVNSIGQPSRIHL